MNLFRCVLGTSDHHSRLLLALSAGLLFVPGCGAAASAPAVTASGGGQLASSTAAAYTFLYNQMDTYATGSTTRLPPSYVNTSAFNVGDVAYLYDSDAMIIALLKRGNGTDISRAEILGNALVYAQTHDAAGDGRVRNSYHTNPFISASGALNVNDTGSATGIMAWTGMALVQLYHATGNVTYLTASENLASWIQNNTNSTTGSGGYTAGLNASGTKLNNKATEHQIDLYAFFTMLASASGTSTYTTYATHAYNELMAMWNSTGGYYYIGTLSDGVTIDTVDDPTPEDIQSWSYLATKLASHQQSMDWAMSHLAVSGSSFSGLEFDTGDHASGVWFEGTAHVATALRIRYATGDATNAATLIDDLENAQSYGANTDGNGIIASSINGLEADGSPQYYSALHVGATAWYCLAAEWANPFSF